MLSWPLVLYVRPEAQGTHSGPLHTPPLMTRMVDVREVCASVMGYNRYVPCRICTAFVPRYDLEPGLLPEETHHDTDALKRFFQGEIGRRQEMGQRHKQETNARMNVGPCGDQHTESDKGAVRKKPAAASRSSAIVRKKPAASTPKVMKKPARMNQRAARRRIRNKTAPASIRGKAERV